MIEFKSVMAPFRSSTKSASIVSSGARIPGCSILDGIGELVLEDVREKLEPLGV